MRALCFLCALFVLLLAIKPCCNDSECNFKTDAVNQPVNNKDVKGNDCKGCSPFFACGTCAGFVVAGNTCYSITTIREPHIKHYAPYLHPCVQHVTLSIWQPPQLS
ncbi:hypothetical protein FFF34_011150 [Inquilinus sp. KBS0705]|nr:hypothetical protein FFF34_011150 [Inquilinus sp. KBS0705]